MLNRRAPSKQWAAVALLAALILLSLIIRSFKKSQPPGAPVPDPVIVEVLGDVEHPGNHLLAGPSATVGDAVNAAGLSAKSGAPAFPEELARKAVRTGVRIHILHQPPDGWRVRTEPMDAAARLTLGLKLDLNEASEEDLLLVPRMKPEVASAIVSRRGRAPWRSLADLTEIPGVGPKTVEKWRDYLEVRGHQ